MVEGSIERIAPLVEELQRFCRGHLAGDRGAAAAEMLAYLRAVWPDVPGASLPSEPDLRLSAEELALVVVRDVGEVAGQLLESREPAEALAWSRANLIFDLERYATVLDTSA